MTDMAFPAQTAATFLENWPAALADVSVRSAAVPLSEQDMKVLGGMTPSFRESQGYYDTDHYTDGFLEGIDAALEEFPEGVMPRLGYCSWKASTVVHGPAFGRRGVLSVLSQPDDRIANALAVHLAHGAPAVLHLREFVEIPPWAELRLFFRQRTLVGVSQYHYQSFFEELVQLYQPLTETVARFADSLLAKLHLDDVVADIFVALDDDGEVKPTLIELNPFDKRTDPCLFSWTEPGDFDGTFRIY